MKRRVFLKLGAAAALAGTASSEASPTIAYPDQEGPISDEPPKKTRGIPSARNVDHCGFTVPNLDEAILFFTEILGGDVLWRKSSSGKSPTSDPVKSSELAMLRLGPNINIELLEFKAVAENRKEPRIADVGASHLAIYVDDLDAAATYLSAHKVTLFHGPNQGAQTGERFRYFRSPWGMLFELVSRAKHSPYEKDTSFRLYGPAPDWNA